MPKTKRQNPNTVRQQEIREQKREKRKESLRLIGVSIAFTSMVLYLTYLVALIFKRGPSPYSIIAAVILFFVAILWFCCLAEDKDKFVKETRLDIWNFIKSFVATLIFSVLLSVSYYYVSNIFGINNMGNPEKQPFFHIVCIPFVLGTIYMCCFCLKKYISIIKPTIKKIGSTG